METTVGDQREKSLVVKHVHSAGSDQPETIVTIMGREPLRFHLHSDHAELEQSYGRLQEYLGRLNSRLRYFHLSENDARQTSTGPWVRTTRSTTNWLQHYSKLKATGNHGTITLEAFTSQEEYLLLS